jgi:hypothetical protein
MVHQHILGHRPNSILTNIFLVDGLDVAALYYSLQDHYTGIFWTYCLGTTEGTCLQILTIQYG